ncbi:MAG: hypothetical protein U0904_02440, partial [Candidatus Nanopelagicales bacterium]|nr:hypothetical protein [Candidatus Nanopelagicales bacterium]
LNQAIRLTKQWRKENPDLDGYRLGGAQLQKADAAPPWTGRKRWVVTFENPGFFDEQLLVYMNGKVKKAQP